MSLAPCLALAAALLVQDPPPAPTGVPDPAPEAQHVARIAPLPDGSVLVVRAGGPRPPLRRIDPTDGGELAPFHGGHEELIDLAIHGPSDGLAWVDHSGTVRVWPLSAGLDLSAAAAREEAEVRCSIPDQGDPRTATWSRVAWSASGAHLVTWGAHPAHGGLGAPVRVWSRGGELLWTGPRASDVAVHPLHDELAIATLEARVLVGWPGRDGKDLERGPDAVPLDGIAESVSYSPDGARLAVGGQRRGADGHDETRLWMLAHPALEQVYAREVVGVDPLELKTWVHRVRFSPDSRHLGVSLGKGSVPGILDAQDGSAVWTGDFRGGQMWSIFEVSWTRDGRLFSSWPRGLLGDPARPDSREELPFATGPTAISIPGSRDVIVRTLAVDRPPELVRVDPATGEVRWRMR